MSRIRFRTLTSLLRRLPHSNILDVTVRTGPGKGSVKEENVEIGPDLAHQLIEILYLVASFVAGWTSKHIRNQYKK